MSEYIVEVKGQMPDAIFERELTEIVRCKDCVWYLPFPGSLPFPGMQITYGICQKSHLEVDEDGFCAWSERWGQ